MYYPQIRLPVVLLAVHWLLLPIPAHAVGPHYTVTSDERLEQLEVRACFESAVPTRLKARLDDASGLLRDAQLHTSDEVLEIEPRGTILELPPVSTPACVHYRVDLESVSKRHWRSNNWRRQDAIIIDPGSWLWIAEGRGSDERWRLDFVLPADYDVSAPWSRIGRNGRMVSYEVRTRMPQREARIAIGRFRVESIELPGGRVRYALLSGTPEPDTDFIRQWVTTGARALATAYGRLPVPDLQLLVVPVGHGDEPVPWGEVQRGGGDAVHLFINQRLSEEAFMNDWVLVHELSHLLHPVIISDDRWLSEGIASYYQNVLRARVGLKSPESAWNKLHAGFERGIRGTPRGRSLAEVSETMMRDRSFMRVYWSGAAIALLADVELRRRSDGAQSLDTALEALHACCLPADRHWTGRELMQELDRLTGTRVFMELYNEHIGSDEFPDLAAVYEELGLERVSTTRLRLDPEASGASICASIMAVPDS
ncbi:MAG: hypothetical protein JSW45_06000 [Thiotrichales bacterium]|nr:MAG: hypothetical protein JSW45_06000 [Thiotrichales bacterium]